MAQILVGTANGLHGFDASGAQLETALAGHDVRALAPELWTRLWAVVDARSLWRRDDGGDWSHVASLPDDSGGEGGGLEALCIADTRANEVGGILVGTSDARLFRAGADGSLVQLAGFDDAPTRDEWYTPWGGPPDTRTITEDGDSVYVNVHVGGVLRSRDEGATWQPTIDLHADVHRVVTGHGRVYAAGAHGLSISADGGDTWRLCDAGLHATYCRAVAVCGSSLLLSASAGPDGRQAALYRGDVAGEWFERCTQGLPEWFDGNLDSLCVDALPDGSLAAFGTHSGEVLVSQDGGVSWGSVAAGLGSIRCVLVLP